MTTAAEQPWVDAREVAADTLWKLLDAKVIPPTVLAARRALDVLGLTRDDLRAAQERAERATTVPLRLVHRKPANADSKTGPATAGKMRKKNPTPTTRRCSRCREVLPIDQFDIKSPRTGSLRSMCKACCKEYQRDRYLTVEKSTALKHVLSFVVSPDDDCVGVECEWCCQAIEVGQRVQGETRLEHVSCPK